jgi:chromosome segregation ATPase
LEQIIGELREKERLLIEYENKIALFTQEIERLNNNIRNKQN